MGDSINILVLNDFSLFPINHGGKVRIFNIYKNFSYFYPVKYLCFGTEESIREYQIAPNFYEIQIPKRGIHQMLINIAKKVFKNSMDDIIALFIAQQNRMMKDTLKRYIADSSIVILAHPYMYPAVKPFITNQLLIYEAYNVEYLLKKSMFNGNILFKVILDRVFSNEKDLVHNCNLCFTISNFDKQSMCNLYGVESSKIIIAPNGANPAIYPSKSEPGQFRADRVSSLPIAVFIGSGHPPNVEAARIIIEKIAPKMPDIHFLICGSVCWSVNYESRGENVSLAYIISEDEKIELFRVADIAINPMLSGSGTNIKMLDFMAAGLPVVTTNTGARGLNIEDGIHGLICSIEQFPEGIRRLIHDDKLYWSISKNEKRIVEDNYDWKYISTIMISAIVSSLSKKQEQSGISEMIE